MTSASGDDNVYRAESLEGWTRRGPNEVAAQGGIPHDDVVSAPRGAAPSGAHDDSPSPRRSRSVVRVLPWLIVGVLLGLSWAVPGAREVVAFIGLLIGGLVIVGVIGLAIAYMVLRRR